VERGREPRQSLRGLHPALWWLLSERAADPPCTIASSGAGAGETYERNDAAAIRQTMALADRETQPLHRRAQAVGDRQAGRIADAELQAVCTQGIELFRVLATALKPILRETSARSRRSWLRRAPRTLPQIHYTFTQPHRT
jgi:hypothetical protein